MAICIAMEISPAKIIKEYGFVALHNASGIPLGTLSRWKNKGVPGKGSMKQMREAQLLAALQKLKSDGVPTKAEKAKRRKAA